MPERYLEAIIKYLADRNYQPLKVRQLARRIGVADQDYDAFRDAVKRLRDAGRVVLGPSNSLTLPAMTDRVTGTYRANPRGFGFVVPDEPNAHGDLFIPEGEHLDAVTGDRVVARVMPGGRRGGKAVFRGRVVEVLARGQSRFVGELARAAGPPAFWFVTPQGRALSDPVVVDDVGPAGAAGQKVMVEIVQYPTSDQLAHGVIVEMLGAAGPIDVETLGIIREHGLNDEFSGDALADARGSVEGFRPEAADGREDYTDKVIVTIDPDDARDYDDAISLEPRDGGGFTLGVHIADVSHFVLEGSALDDEARQRGNSVYFPRRVVPMLPEVLSNGVCSLQEGQVRYVKTAWIDYDAEGAVQAARLANGRIRSAKRLTYRQAQGILEGKSGGYDGRVVRLVGQMNALARAIEVRRRKAGMLHLDLPEVELVLTPDGRVADAVTADDSYTHTIIEMFMVEANEAAARLLDRLNVPFLRRIHPDKDEPASKHLKQFIRACGLKIPAELGRSDMQALIERVRGRPESHAVNLAILKMLQRAEYSPMRIGHFALASDCYCHFTSPIRRYPDLTVHRLIDQHLRGRLDPQGVDAAQTAQLGTHLSYTERRAATAERELRMLLVLQMLAERIGEVMEGVVTGVTTYGVFVQSTRYLVEGLVRLEELGDDWWDVHPEAGVVVGERSGRRIRLGDAVTVSVRAVDLARRELDLRLESAVAKKPRSKRRPGKRR